MQATRAVGRVVADQAGDEVEQPAHRVDRGAVRRPSPCRAPRRRRGSKREAVSSSIRCSGRRARLSSVTAPAWHGPPDRPSNGGAVPPPTPAPRPARPAAVAPARRVVSLVPSLTEAVAATAPGLLVGATDWCTHPAGPRRRAGRRHEEPRRRAIVALRPGPRGRQRGGEPRRRHRRAARRRAARSGSPRSATLAAGASPRCGGCSSRRCGLAASRGGWTRRAAAWGEPPGAAARVRAVVPIWRRPVDGAGPRHLRRRPAGPPRRATTSYAGARRALPADRPSTSSAPRRRPRGAARRAVRASPPTTAPRRSPACPPRWSAAGTSPGTAPRSPRPPPSSAPPCGPPARTDRPARADEPVRAGRHPAARPGPSRPASTSRSVHEPAVSQARRDSM